MKQAQKRKITSFQTNEATDRQVEILKAKGFGGITEIVRTAIDRMYQQETTMPTLREIITANREWAFAHSDREIAEHIAAKPTEQVDSAIRNLASAFRPTGGLHHKEGKYTHQSIAVDPVGELLDQQVEVEYGHRAALTPEEIEPVVAWLRANLLPLKTRG